jgi:hypothetical protein
MPKLLARKLRKYLAKVQKNKKKERKQHYFQNAGKQSHRRHYNKTVEKKEN